MENPKQPILFPALIVIIIIIIVVPMEILSKQTMESSNEMNPDFGFFRLVVAVAEVCFMEWQRRTKEE